MSEIMIETRNLTKIFGNLTACDNINLKFESGKIHAIAGGKAALHGQRKAGQNDIDENAVWRIQKNKRRYYCRRKHS